ncbi:MAG: apolipoprotein N-acyltransferase [Prolixibacteraceae bacterium]|nr:apolipoprotein N-acyltransferase [Prolixibacteraceae bacterium]
MHRKFLFFFLSGISGILLSLPWLIEGLSWTLFFAFCPLLFAEDQLSRQNDGRKSIFFFPAFTTFLIWNALSTWWIAYVSLVGMLFIVVLNALLMASVWCSRQLINRKFSLISSYFSLIIFWLAFEFLHHNWTLPWPWLSLGNGFANSVKLVQWYEFTGILGGSLWILLSNNLIYSAILSFATRQSSLKSLKRASMALVFIFLPIVGSLYIYSNYTEKGSLLNVVSLQPNIDPYTEKFSGLSSSEQIIKLIELAETQITNSTDLVVAPETAWPTLWEDSILTQNQSLLPLSEVIRKFPNVNFVVGAITQRKIEANETISETARKSVEGDFYFDTFNSALMIDSTQKIQISHKSILVNGVEQMPFQKYFSFLGKFLINLGGNNGSMTASKEPVIFEGNHSMKYGSVICFESVFGEYCSKIVQRGANVLVVITNDGWWKSSPGSWQHFSYSRLRALETRRSIVQSANTGISGFINQRGNVLKKTKLNSFEAIQSTIQLNAEVTFYSNYGDYLGRICQVLSGLISAFTIIYNKNFENKKIRINSIVKIPDK